MAHVYVLVLEPRGHHHFAGERLVVPLLALLGLALALLDDVLYLGLAHVVLVHVFIHLYGGTSYLV